MNKKESWSGERLETFVLNDSTIEHLHRYAIAKEFVQGKRVLDIACGEGYGSNLLAASAYDVTGADIDQPTITHASKKYKRRNLSFIQAPVEKIPFEAATFDVVVCFETLEHTTQHTTIIKELKRVLKHDGLLLISTPDKKTYSDIPGYKNPFHKKELYQAEFEKLLSDHFRYHSLYYQNLHLASLLMNANRPSLKIYEGDYTSIKNPDTIEPLYFLALCSDQEIPDLPSSIFTSRGTLETALFEKEKAIKNLPSYKLGHALLSPAKFIRKLFRKKTTPH
ncbi:MAG: methyltransferase domain-containing protein [Chitinophagaceae bacterium]